MLLQLSIHHLALIQDMTIDFAPGMNVMTGETGAGKSIVVDAVNLVLGERADKQKSNDDGEPGGTAGNPILEAIKKNALTDVVIVVTRYFGGIKLGAGGLIRAYGHAAVLGIEAATRIEMTPFTELHVTIGYDLLATVEHWIRQQEIRTEEADYAEAVTLHLLLPPAEVESRLTELRDLTSANFQSEVCETRRIALPC